MTASHAVSRCRNSAEFRFNVWFGAAVGLLAAALFAFTPIAAAMFGRPTGDGALTTRCTPVPAADHGGDAVPKLFRCG